MMLLIVFLVLLFAVVFYLLLIPIILYVDTAKNQYYVKLGSLAKAIIQEDKEEVLKIKFRMFFLNFYFYPLKRKPSPKKKKREKEKKKRKKRIGIRTGLRILKSFNLKKLLLDIDTGNYVSNAKLYPVFGFLMYYTKGNFNINYEGRNRMVLFMKNRPIHLIRSYINI